MGAKCCKPESYDLGDIVKKIFQLEVKSLTKNLSTQPQMENQDLV